MYRSSKSEKIWKSQFAHPEVFYKNDVLRNFTKITGKHLCQILFFNKVAGLRPPCFPVNFAKFLRTPFLEHLRVNKFRFPEKADITYLFEQLCLQSMSTFFRFYLFAIFWYCQSLFYFKFEKKIFGENRPEKIWQGDIHQGMGFWVTLYFKNNVLKIIGRMLYLKPIVS